MRRFALTAFAAMAVTAALPAAAQDSAPVTPDTSPDIDGDRVTIGVGAVSMPDYEGADHSAISPGAVVVGKVGGYDFFTRGAQLYVDLVRDPGGPGVGFELGPIVSARFERTGHIDNDRVAALGKFDTAWEVGGFVGVSKTGVVTSDFDTLTARVAIVQDVSDTHGSYVITPQINYTTPLSYSTLVSIGASADYVGKGYGRTYFSVTPAGSVASGLRTYDIDEAGFKVINLSAFALQSLTGDLRHGLGLGAGVLYGRMLGKYKDSPLVSDVGSANQWVAAVGLAYTF